MSDINLEQTEPTIPVSSQTTEHGEMYVMEDSEGAPAVAPSPSATITPVPAAAQRKSNRSATIEHLAARQNVTPLNDTTPEVKQRINELRTECTTLVTGLRWDGLSVQQTVERIIPLLDAGPLQQWIPLVIPTILETDRAGNLIPVWLKVIEQEDPVDVPPDENPAETTIGRARRIAILMLGYYKSPEVSQILGTLAADPRSSLYATRSLVKQSSIPAMQALANALREAEGWAKVDVVDAYALMNLARFHDILLARGLDSANGLESYIAAPLFRTIPLERYLRGGQEITPRLSEQAALIFGQILQDSTSNTSIGTDTLPIVFERDLPTLATALFEGARSTPTWQYAVALHRLALLLSRYWTEISRGTVHDQHITQPVYVCSSMMPEIERWMNGPGRNVLLEAFASSEDEAFLPSLKVLAELHEPQAISVLMNRLEAAPHSFNREQAIILSQICKTLGQSGDPRVGPALLQFIQRVVDIEARTNRPKRPNNLEEGDTNIPGSIVYAAVIRALTQLDSYSEEKRLTSALSFIARAANDFDPYVRLQALEALKTLDPNGNEMSGRIAVSEALNDPSTSVAQSAAQLSALYRDREPSL